MNYRPLLNLKLQDFEKKYPNYSFGETVHAMFSCMKLDHFSKGTLIQVSDEDLYRALSHAYNNEDEE